MKILKAKSLNINSLKGEFVINFESFLKNESLFAITGPTGAGKSTILDIITCALYGRTARLVNPNELMSRHTGEAFCEVEFEIEGKVYRSSWGVNRARKNADGKFQAAKMEIVDVESGKVLESYLSRVPKLVEELTGLDFDRFIQSMMLAQGSFDAFLKAKENERSTLLEKITGTYIYKQISQEIYETYAGKKKEIELDENSLGSIALLEKDVVAEKMKVLEDSRKEKVTFDIKEVELKKLASWVEELFKLESDNMKYTHDYEQIIKEKEEKKDDFLNLELANKALNVQSVYQEKSSLTQIIHIDRQKLEMLQKNLEDLQKLIDLATPRLIIAKENHNKEKMSFSENSKKLKDVRILQTKIQSRIQNINELEAKIKLKQEEKSTINDELIKVKMVQSTTQKELDGINNYLSTNTDDVFLKEDIPLLSKNLSDYKNLIQFLNELVSKLEKNILDEKFFEEQYKINKKEFENIKIAFELKDKEYKKLEQDSLSQNIKEQKNRDRLKTIDKLIDALDDYRKITDGVFKENNIITSSSEELKSLKKRIEEKIKLINEFQKHIQTLNDKRETELLIAKYESDRAKLKEGNECYLCGSRSHPYSNNHICINTDDTINKINEKKQELDVENKILRTDELSLSKLESKIETSILEKEKLLKSKESIESIFRSHNFTLIEDSKINLEEEKKIKEEELNDIVEQRNKKDLLLIQRNSLQTELNTKQTQVLQKEQELYKLTTTKKQLEIEQKQNISEKQSLQQELIKMYKKYNISFGETYDEQFNIIVRRKDEYIKNELSQKEFDSKLQTILVAQKECDIKLSSIDEILKKESQDLLKQSNELNDLRVQSKSILDIVDLDTFEQEIENSFNKITQNYNNLHTELIHLNSKYESLNIQIKELIQKQHADNIILKEIEQNFWKILEENGFISIDEFEKALLSKEEREKLSLTCKSIEEKYMQIQTLKNNTAKKLKEQKELNLTDRELENIKNELNELQVAIDELQKSIGHLEKELEINTQNVKKYEDKIRELKNKKEAFKVWVKLNDMIGSSNGDKFAKFAQGITLDQLIYLANKHLNILNTRYELQRSIDTTKLLEIEIVDAFQGDTVRSINTLSGGENFIVSLSLALGLSNLASQKISIDSLFLDEGFGTLDSASLELALNALNQLQSSGKMVGVISHVEALKESIPLQIKVIPNGDGTSIVDLNR